MLSIVYWTLALYAHTNDIVPGIPTPFSAFVIKSCLIYSFAIFESVCAMIKWKQRKPLSTATCSESTHFTNT